MIFKQQFSLTGAFGYFIVTDDAIARYTKATVFSHVGKKTPLMVRFSTVIGERGSADSARYVYLFYYSENVT